MSASSHSVPLPLSLSLTCASDMSPLSIIPKNALCPICEDKNVRETFTCVMQRGECSNQYNQALFKDSLSHLHPKNWISHSQSQCHQHALTAKNSQGVKSLKQHCRCFQGEEILAAQKRHHKSYCY